jgi:hypothetical protein
MYRFFLKVFLEFQSFKAAKFQSFFKVSKLQSFKVFLEVSEFQSFHIEAFKL